MKVSTQVQAAPQVTVQARRWTTWRVAGGWLVDVVIFDLETTGLSADSGEIIEIGAVLWQDGKPGPTFQTLVRPTGPVSPEIQELTGIHPDELVDAPPASAAIPRFLQFMAGYPLCGHNVAFDIRFLQAACDQHGYDLPASHDGLDTLLLARVLLPFAQEYRLTDLMRLLEATDSDAHRALADATMTAQLLRFLSDTALALPLLTLQQLERLAGFFSPLTARWFADMAETRSLAVGAALPAHCELVHPLVFSSPRGDASRRDTHNNGMPDRSDEEEKPVRDNSDWINEASRLLSAGSPLADVMPSFEIRPGQQQMVEAVSTALEGDQHLMVEAGTGVGKSLAYLIPAALFAVGNDARVVVSTHTIALQDQIRLRDFPTLRHVLAAPVQLTVFKGRTHYVCMRKLAQETNGVGFGTPRDEIAAYMTLLVWLTQTPEGSREELSQPGRLGELWPRVQSETETCINKRCPFFKPCYYFRARAKAYEADVIVTNHSLLFSDIKADHRVLPRYDKVIIDEAHHLEAEATRHLGEEVHELQCLALFGRLVRDGGRHGVLAELAERLADSQSTHAPAVAALELLQELVRDLRRQVESAFATLGQLIPSGHSEFRFTRAIERNDVWHRYLSLADAMQVGLKQLDAPRTVLEETAEQESDGELSGRLFDASGFFEEVVSSVTALCNAGDLNDDWVGWIERSGERQDRARISLHRAPIDVAHILEEVLFNRKSTVVLTSATLSVDGRFDYAMQRVGLQEAQRDGRLATLSVASPFRFDRQALLCIPTDVPELAKMTAGEAAVWLSESLAQLAQASGGRMLALFTSHAMLRATADLLRQPLRASGLALYAQGVDGHRTRILEMFRNQPQSVLLGAQSFWEGIDLPGDQLTTLVIVRLPFAPPSHPVTVARHERLERQGLNPFREVSLPEAVVRFRQGFGRLIRTVHDRGVVVVYDKRIVTSAYGSSFVRAIPGVRTVTAPERLVVEQVRSFLQPAATADTPSRGRAHGS